MADHAQHRRCKRVLPLTGKLIAAVCLLAAVAQAQSTVGAIFLLISPSPAMNGMGQIGAAFPSRDNYSVYFNPANFPQLSGLAFTNSFASQTPWLRNLVSDIILQYEGGLAGLQLDRPPLEFSYGYYRTYLDLGEQERRDENNEYLGTFRSFMSADAITYGAGVRLNLGRLPIRLAVGGATKRIVQDLAQFSPEKPVRSTNIFADWGFLLSAPISVSPAWSKLGIRLEPALGYALLNLGSGISFLDKFQADPPPTLARLGFSIVLSLVAFESQFPLATWGYGREVEDVIIAFRDGPGESNWYADIPFGDIDVVNHLLANKPEEGVTLHRGEEITLLNFYTVRRGQYIDLAGRLEFNTTGTAINVGPLLRLAGRMIGSGTLTGWANILDISYNKSEELGGPRNQTRYTSLTVTITDLDKLIAKLLGKR